MPRMRPTPLIITVCLTLLLGACQAATPSPSASIAPGPTATATSVPTATPKPVNLPRPRDRKAINHDPRFKEIRREVIGYLLGVGGKKHTTLTRKLFLPDLEPEDLSIPRNEFAPRRGPIRRHEIKSETVEINS